MNPSYEQLVKAKQDAETALDKATKALEAVDSPRLAKLKKLVPVLSASELYDTDFDDRPLVSLDTDDEVRFWSPDSEDEFYVQVDKLYRILELCAPLLTN